jgi:chromate transporter
LTTIAAVPDETTRSEAVVGEQGAADDTPAVVPTRRELFLTFFQIGLCGFGGVGPWARRIIVEDRGWMDDRGYTEILTICQVIPGPNVGNVSVVIGDRFHGVVGAVLALVGLMTGPMTILLGLGLLYGWLGEVPAIDGAIGGVAAAAAGLFVGTALKMAERLRMSIPALVILGGTFVAVGLLRWPLMAVVLALAPIAIVLAWRSR